MSRTTDEELMAYRGYRLWGSMITCRNCTAGPQYKSVHITLPSFYYVEEKRSLGHVDNKQTSARLPLTVGYI